MSREPLVAEDIQSVMIECKLTELFAECLLLKVLDRFCHDEVAASTMLGQEVIAVPLKNVSASRVEFSNYLVLTGQSGQVHACPRFCATTLIQIEGLRRL